MAYMAHFAKSANAARGRVIKSRQSVGAALKADYEFCAPDLGYVRRARVARRAAHC